jgi:hypothetical protein
MGAHAEPRSKDEIHSLGSALGRERALLLALSMVFKFVIVLVLIVTRYRSQEACFWYPSLFLIVDACLLGKSLKLQFDASKGRLMSKLGR